jgi:Gpi18-like mannosyltransferase
VLPKFAPDPYRFALAGILLSTISHYLSVLILHRLTTKLFPDQQRFAFTTALLHIITTAGIFLSAPSAEALFSFLSFAGSYVFMTASDGLAGDLQILLAGNLWFWATTVRSNGILNGVVLLWYFVTEPARFLGEGNVLRAITRYFVLGASGVMVGAGLVLPQVVAWLEYCNVRDGSHRPWCEKSVPSIYTWVQNHYW